MSISSVAVYLGSRKGDSPLFVEMAFNLGKELARNNISVVYGGTNVGTMDALANGVLEGNGNVTGVIPERFRSINFTHNGVTKLIKVQDLHERKQIMEDISQAAIILPGSYGTMDELFEYAVNNQLQKLDRPIIVFNLNGFYAPLEAQLDIMVEHGFLSQELKLMFTFCNTIEEIIKVLNKDEC